MSLWSRARLYLRARFEPSEVRAEIDEELRYHLEMRAREYRALGLSRSEAEERSRARFGDLGRARAECRRLAMVASDPTSRKGDAVLSTLAGELRIALRTLVRTPGFSAIVILTLALGIGANTAVFSLVEGILLRPLAFSEPERLLNLWENDRLRGTTQEGFSAPDFFDLAASNQVFEGMALYQGGSHTLTDEESEPARLRVTAVSWNLFDLLGVAPAEGRALRAEDDVPGASPVAVLSHGIWMRRFGGDPGIVGRTIQLEGVSREVVGVMPESFSFPARDTDLWVPAQATATSLPRGNHLFAVIARLRPGVSLTEANANLGAIAGALEAQYRDDNEGRGMWAESTYDSLVGGVRMRLELLLGAVALVLLVACANVANLLLSRAVAREQETSIRAAMGAGRWFLVRQALTESLLLSLSGAVVGIALAKIGLDAFLRLTPADLPRLENVGWNGTVLGFALVVSFAIGLLFGVVPALRPSNRNVARALREGGRSGESAGRGRLRRLLVAAEIALAVALALGAGLLIHSFWKLTGVDPGFEARDVVAVEIQLPASRYPQNFGEWPNWNEVRGFHSELLARVSSLPGVDAAAIALNNPLESGFTSRFTIEGRPQVAPGQQDEVRVRTVSSSYFRTIGVPVARGRGLEEGDDRPESPQVLLVNEAFVRRYFPDQDPIGARIEQWGVSRELVGVVKDVKFLGLDADVPPAIYPTFAQSPFTGFSLLVRGRLTPEQLSARLREAIRAIDRDLALSSFETLDEKLASSVGEPRFTMVLFAFFGLTALALASVGIYGVTAYSVRQRTREIGVRMSLGARKGDVLRLVLLEGAKLAAVGIACGLALALVLARSLENLLFGVGRFDPLAFGAASLVAIVVGLSACYAPAARAARVDPVVALRSD
jgi:putative ABC transport system permease protein